MGKLVQATAPTWFDRHWPQQAERASRQAIVAVVAAAVVAATTIPTDRQGVGWLIATVGVVAALAVVAKRAEGRLRLPWLVAAVALMAVGTFRAADWLFPLSVLTACVAGSLAVAGGRSMRGMAFGGIAIGLAAFRALPWLGRGLRALRSKEAPSGPKLRIGRSVLITAVLLLVFGSLLASADRGFARLITALIPDWDISGGVQWVFVACAVGFATLGAAYLLANPASADDAPAAPVRKARAAEWVLPVGVLVAMFAAFVVIQVAVLFGGSEYVLTTPDLTYAQYARSGFWQLLAVTVLTLGVLVVAARVAPVETAQQRLLVRGLLGALAVLTLVIVVSAIGRMWTYQQTYGFTVLRLVVEVCEVWLGLVYVLILAAGVRLRAAWLARAAVGSAVAMLIGLAAVNPEGLVAQQNVTRHAETGKIDLVYLGHLSADAVPALEALPERMRDCVLARIAMRTPHPPDSAMSWNLSRASAKESLANAQKRTDYQPCDLTDYR